MGVVTNLEAWERSEVLFPSFPLHSFPSPPLFSLFSPTLPSLLLSDGSNFNDFSENQLIDFAFLYKPVWRNAAVSPFPFVLMSFGGTAFPAFPLNYTTDGHMGLDAFLSLCGS